MGLRRASLVLYILIFIFQLQHNFPSVSSRPSSSVATSHETLPFSASKPDVVVFEGKSRELAVVIKRGGGGGRGGGGRGGSGGSSRGGGGSGSNRVGRVVPVGTGGGSHGSSGSRRNLRGAVCAVGWLGLSVLVGLFLV